jgi:hypothetical protein
MMKDPSPWHALDPELNVRLAELADDGRRLWNRFDLEVRRNTFHSFLPADYDAVLLALLELRAPGLRFLEWGSATGVITIMADLLGFEACGIEADPALVSAARQLAADYGAGPTFVAGNFLPPGYEYRPRAGHAPGMDLGGPSGYALLGRGLHDFDIVYGYPWPGEEDVMLEIMRAYGGPAARLLLYSADGRLRTHRPPCRGAADTAD